VTQLSSDGDSSGVLQGCQLLSNDFHVLSSDPPIPDPTSEHDLSTALASVSTGYGEGCGSTSISTIEAGNFQLEQANNELTTVTSAILQAQHNE
jgi:hypothetical protein